MDERKIDYDLTKGGIFQKILLISLPIMGTQLVQMAYNLTDIYWLGKVGSDMVAAAGTAGMYLWLSNGFMFIGRMGAEIGVSQHLGAGDEKGAREYSQNALFLSMVLGVLYAGVMMLFSPQLIGFFQIRETHVVDYAIEYLFVTALGIPATFISSTIAGTFHGSGNSITPFFVNLVGLVVNMILDPFFILNLEMGIVGAAVATIVAQFAVTLLALLIIKHPSLQPLKNYRIWSKPKKHVLRQIVTWSTPIALESMFFTLLSMIISRFIAFFGADAIAVQRVGSQIESLSWLVTGGFATALTAFIGQNYGAGKWTRIHRGVKVALATIVSWGAFVTLLLYFAGGSLFRLFLPDPALVEVGQYYLRVLSLCQIIGALESVGSGGFRGIGRTLPPSIASICSNAGRVVFTYFLAQTYGLNGIWWGITLGACVRGLWIFFWFMGTLRNQPTQDLILSDAEEPEILPQQSL